MCAGQPNGQAASVEERLRRLSATEFVAFCAALWAARGYATRVEGDRFVATRDPERLVVRPLATPGLVTRTAERLSGVRDLLGRLGLSTAASTPDDTVDVVVTPVETARATRLAERHNARLVGPAALADLLLYGIPRRDAEALVGASLGASAETLRPGAGERTTSLLGRVSVPPPTALVAVVGVGCLVLAAAAAGVWVPSEDSVGNDAAPPLLTGAGAEPTPTATVTPSSTSTVVVENTSRAGYPPGAGDGYLDAWELSRAHAAEVSGRSYRLIVRQSDTDALDGEHRWDGVWQHAVVQNERTWLYSVVGYAAAENGSDLVQYTTYADGDAVYRRVDLRSGLTYERAPLAVDDDGYGTQTDRTRRYVLRYLTTTEVDIDRPSWSPDLYRITATGRPAYVRGDVVNYTATAFVDRSGFVSELTVEFTRVENGTREPARFRFEYAAVGDTRLRPPGWYDEARAATATNATSGG